MSLQDELAQRAAEGMRTRLAAFKPRVLSWLLLLPEWTEKQWPFGTELIDRFDDSGLIERRDTIDVGDAFWVRESVRPELARYVREVRGPDLEEDLEELASSSWLGTLTSYRRDASGRTLMSEVERLIDDGQTGEATRLTAAARLLGEALAEPLADAARRARWRIDRAIRTAEDERRLKYYVRRESIEAELSALRAPSAGYYAMHLLGGGGTGKTMVIRHLCSTSRTPVARIDFDHLDPRYPEQRPGEILLALAGELLGYGTTREADASYKRLRDAVDAVHEELASDIPPRSGEPRLTKMIRAFSRFAGLFPEPVLLVLDTCEELAKLYEPGTAAPAIDQTFRILERVHQSVPSARFVLAGRRWLVPPPDEVASAGMPRLRPRPWVRVLPVTGFTRAEARTYLRMHDMPSGAMAEALLRRSAAVDGTCNPFELASYCEWALSDPDLDPDELRNAPGDPLVERRIIGRVTDGIRAAVPVTAAFGRFDLELIKPALRRASLDARKTFDELSAQEWIDVRSVDKAGRPRVIEVDEHLRARILQVTTARHPLDTDALGRDAVAAIERSELPELPVEYVEAAVRMLTVTDAGSFWSRLEDRITAERAWGWAAQVSVRAGAAEKAHADGSGPTILGAILATQAAARIHTADRGDVLELWRAVEDYAPRHPDPAEGKKLALRGLLGRLAAGDRDADPETVPRPVRTDLAGSFVAAAQRLMADERDASGFIARAGVTGSDGRINAILNSLKAVLELWHGNYEGARAYADTAVTLADGKGRDWADWVPPHGPAERCRLTRLFVAWASGEALDALPWEAWRDEAVEHLDDVDAERLVSLALRFEGGHRRVPRALQRRIRVVERYAARRPADWLHVQIRPLIVELALAPWADDGAGYRMLAERIEEAVAAGDDPDTVDVCQLAQMRLCRRRRSADLSTVMGLSLEATPMVRAEAWLVRELLWGEHPLTVDQAGSWHGWWQCQASPPHTPRPPERDQGVPRDIIRADLAEYRGCFGLPPSGVLAVPPSFDPEQILRGEGSLEALAPGERGRAMLAVGEALAIRSPEHATELLAEAVSPLRDAGDDVSAAQAAILAVLATVRAGHVEVAASLPLPAGWLTDGWRPPPLPEAWKPRLAVARLAYQGEPPPADLTDASPELRWPAASPRDLAGEMEKAEALAGSGSPARPRAPAGLGYIRGGWLVAGGTLALAALFTDFGFFINGLSSYYGPSPASNILAVLGVVVIVLGLVVILTRAVAARIGAYWHFASPPRRRLEFGAARGTVFVTGCRAAVVDGQDWAGHIVVRPVRRQPTGTWAPREPRLPIGWKRPLILNIDADTELDDRDWEQWLGRAYPHSRRADLLYFRYHDRRSPDGAAAPETPWNQTTYAYQGPGHILMVSPRPDRTARALHLVGTPVSTRGGWRFRVAETGTATPKGRGTQEGGTLVSPGSIRPTPPLIVLQADPVDGVPEPLGEDRPGYILLARSFLDGGATAVLVIPPLNDELASTLARLVNRTVLRLSKPLRPTDLLLLLAQLKRRVHAEAAPTGDEDPVLDMLLFLRNNMTRKRGRTSGSDQAMVPRQH